MTDLDSLLLVNLEYFGRVYREEHLGMYRVSDLENDWWSALDFFFSRSFMRGRRDKLSIEYKHFAYQTIQDYFQLEHLDPKNKLAELKAGKQLFDKDNLLKAVRSGSRNFDTISVLKDSFNIFIQELMTEKTVEVKFKGKIYPKNIALTNVDDIMMVLDVLDLVSDLEDGNIYRYILSSIKDEGVENTYGKLIALRGVGDKIANFIIRDIMILNEAENLPSSDYERAFPIDTWVRKVADNFGYKDKKGIDVKRGIIEQCEVQGRNPLLVAAGAWFIGFNSLDILLKNLDKYRFVFD